MSLGSAIRVGNLKFACHSVVVTRALPDSEPIAFSQPAPAANPSILWNGSFLAARYATHCRLPLKSTKDVGLPESS